MPTFITVVHDIVRLSVEGSSISSVVTKVEQTLLDGAAQGSRTSVQYKILERDDGKVFHLAVVSLLNSRRRTLDKAMVWGEQPMKAKKRYHATDHRTCIKCKECGNDEFYNVDRSLDYENHICSECGATAHTLTETGASA